jgi:flagellar motor component MotA
MPTNESDNQQSANQNFDMVGEMHTIPFEKEEFFLELEGIDMSQLDHEGRVILLAEASSFLCPATMDEYDRVEKIIKSVSESSDSEDIVKLCGELLSELRDESLKEIEITKANSNLLDTIGRATRALAEGDMEQYRLLETAMSNTSPIDTAEVRRRINEQAHSDMDDIESNLN